MFTLRTARLVDLDYGRGIATSILKEFVVELNPVDEKRKDRNINRVRSRTDEPKRSRKEKYRKIYRVRSRTGDPDPEDREERSTERWIDKPLSEENEGEK